MAFEPAEVIALVNDELLPVWFRDRQLFDTIDRWMRWDHDRPHSPRKETAEHRELAARSQTPWGDLLVTSLAQLLYVEGYRRPSDPTNASAWSVWQANRMDGHQVALHRDTIAFGLAYGLSLPGSDPLTGVPRPTMRGVSPREMVALYEDPAYDEWPVVAARVVKQRKKQLIYVYDDTYVHQLQVTDGFGGKARYDVSAPLVHGVGVVPVVRFTHRLDLQGRVTGGVEPFIPVLARSDQTTYDRLVVQRFASWVVRTIAGMTIAESARDGESAEQAKLRLKVEDFLIAEDPDTKFGSLPATPLGGFIEAAEADVRVLASVSQTPAHELSGQYVNLSAEALVAAKASQTAKANESKHSLGESYEQWMRLVAHISGDEMGAGDYEAQVRWADTEVRSLGQVVDALSKMAQSLGLPLEVLWEMVPGFTDLDVDRAKTLLAAGAPTAEPSAGDQAIEPAAA